MDAVDLSQFHNEGFQPDVSPNMSEVFMSIIENAIGVNSFGVEISYDWSMTVAPNQQGQLMPVYILLMQMPTLVLGEVAQSFAMLAAAGLGQGQLEEVVRSSIEEMRAQRDAQRLP